MQIGTGFSLGQGSKLQGAFITEMGSLLAAHRTFLFPSLLCTSFVFQHLGFWNGPRMPVELPDLDKAPLCLWLHRPFRINQGGNRKSALPTPPLLLQPWLQGRGWSMRAGVVLQKRPLVSVYPNRWWERPGNASQTLTCLSPGPLCADS